MTRARKRVFRLPIRRRSAWERDVEDEILLHLSLRAEQFARQGMTPDAARDEAVRRFGPLNETRADLLEAARHREDHLMRVEYLDDLKQDVGYAFRTLRRQRGWTTVAVLTLALGIAATTAVWSAASTLLLHPLPYPDADRIVMVGMQATQGNHTGVNVSISPTTILARAWRSHARTFEALEPFTQGSMTVSDGGEGVSIGGAGILPSFLRFAGQSPLVGPGITDQDVSTKAPVVVISESMWRTRYAAAESVVGKTLTVDGVPRRIVGVYPASLHMPLAGRRLSDVWIPLDLSDDRQGLRMIGRLRAGLSPEAAQRELNQIAKLDNPGFKGPSMPFETVVTTPGRTVQFRDSLIVLTGAVALVLLVACANVAHLLLARTVSRRRELAIRTALGAAKSRMFRLLLTESVVLAILGAGLGVGGGYLGLKAIVAFRPASLQELRNAHVDGYSLLMIVGAALLCGVFFGITSTFSPWRKRTNEALAAGALSDSAPRRSNRFRSALVISEMAMSGLLLVGAVLLIRTVVNLQHSDLGFDPQHLYGVMLDLPDGRFPSPEARQAAIKLVEDRIARSTHVKGITVANTLPDSRSFAVGALEVDGEPKPPAGTAFIDVNAVAPDYFKTVGARIVAGRTIQDTTAHSHDVLINSSYARKHWGEASPLGKRIRITFNGGEADWNTIVGVVDDIAMGGPVTERGAPMLYRARNDHHNPGLIVRTDGDPAVLPQILEAVRLLKPTLVPTVTSTGDVVSASISAPRFIMTLLASFTALALILASIGLYGVMSYSVAQRSREIGIRIALGATPREIGRTVLVRGTALAIIGAAVGLLLASWGTKIVEGSLYGVTRLDPVSFAVGAVLLIASAVAACVVPMRRAVRVDPIEAIRAG
jgi:putative ABC transport system permease protein